MLVYRMRPDWEKLMHMPHFSKRLLYFSGFLCLLLFAWVSANTYRQEATVDAATLSAELKEFIVPHIAMGGKIYTVDGGVVSYQGTAVPPATAVPILRTAYFSVANRLDPILALEGTDPDALAVAVAELEESLSGISSLYGVKEQRLLTTSFYPISFLKTLPALEKERRAVLARPTPHNTIAYAAALLDALGEYREAISKSLSAFASFIEAHEALYNFPGGATSFGTFEGRLAALDASAEAAQVKIKERLDCLKGKAGCKAIALPSLRGQSPSPLALQALSPEREHTMSFLSSLQRAISKVAGKSFSERGTIVLSESACTPGVSPLPGYLWQTRRGTETPAFRFHPANELYFYDLQEEESSEFYSRMREKGFRFIWQGISNLYECPDSGLDLGRAATVYTLARTVADNPLFRGTAPADPALKKIAEGEQRIADAPYFSENAVATHITALAVLIQEKGERVLAQESSPETVVEAERRIALWRSRTALFDEQISTALSMNGVVRGITGVVGKPIPLHQLYMSRSYPSLLYLAGNESLVQTPISFLNEKIALDASKFKLIPYSTLRTQYSEEEILRMLDASIEAYHEAGIDL